MELISNVYRDLDENDDNHSSSQATTQDINREHPINSTVKIDVRKYLKASGRESKEEETTPSVEPIPKRPKKDTSGMELLQMLPAPKKQMPIKDIRTQKGSSFTSLSKESYPSEEKWNQLGTVRVDSTQQEEDSQDVERNNRNDTKQSNIRDEQVEGGLSGESWPESMMEGSKEFLRDMSKYGSDIKLVDVQFSDLIDTSKPDETFVTRQSASTSEVVSKLARVAGKVTRIQKERHQLNAVAADLAAKQVELEEKRSKSRQTKAETWAKYGW